MPPQQRHGGGGKAATQQRPQYNHYQTFYGKKPPKSKPKSTSGRTWCCICSGVLMLAAAVAAGIVVYRELYPSEQRCPPESDRFHDHCKEGRKHYQLSLDWDCLGSRRAEAMRQALSLPSDGKPLKGVGEVPSWLADGDAATLENAPCMKGMKLDKACYYCVPTPRPPRPPTPPQASPTSPQASRADSTEQPAPTPQPTPTPTAKGEL